MWKTLTDGRVGSNKTEAMSTSVRVAIGGLESGLRSHETKIDRSRSVRAPLN